MTTSNTITQSHYMFLLVRSINWCQMTRRDDVIFTNYCSLLLFFFASSEMHLSNKLLGIRKLIKSSQLCLILDTNNNHNNKLYWCPFLPFWWILFFFIPEMTDSRLLPLSIKSHSDSQRNYCIVVHCVCCCQAGRLTKRGSGSGQFHSSSFH